MFWTWKKRAAIERLPLDPPGRSAAFGLPAIIVESDKSDSDGARRRMRQTVEDNRLL